MSHIGQLGWMVTLAALGAAALPSAEPPSFDPYRVIIERAIFGRPPAAPAAAPAALAEQKQAEELARKITMCAVNRTPSGKTAVGLIDNEAKPPRNLYLNVGDSSDGYTILAADYDAETATIEKEGIAITLKLGKGLIGVGAETPPAAATQVAATQIAAAPPPGQPFSRRVTFSRDAGANPQPPTPELPPAPPLEYRADGKPRVPEGVRQAIMERRAFMAAGGTPESYMQALKERREAEEQARAAERQQQLEDVRALAATIGQEAAAARERAINLQRLRDGLDPISAIELTPEEEDELVRKGALSSETTH